MAFRTVIRRLAGGHFTRRARPRRSCLKIPDSGRREQNANLGARRIFPTILHHERTGNLPLVSRFFVDRSSHGRSHRDGNKDSLGLTRDFERRIADQRGMQFVGRGYFSLARYDRSTAVRRFGVLLDRVECFSKVEADCVVAFAPRVDDRFPVREASSPSVSFSFPAASPRTIAPENPARYIR